MPRWEKYQISYAESMQFLWLMYRAAKENTTPSGLPKRMANQRTAAWFALILTGQFGHRLRNGILSASCRKWGMNWRRAERVASRSNTPQSSRRMPKDIFVFTSWARSIRSIRLKIVFWTTSQNSIRFLLQSIMHRVNIEFAEKCADLWQAFKPCIFNTVMNCIFWWSIRHP